jgi:hypothetical protein
VDDIAGKRRHLPRRFGIAEIRIRTIEGKNPHAVGAKPANSREADTPRRTCDDGNTANE